MAQLIKYWNTLKGSYWFIPTVMSIMAALLSFALTAIDSRIGGAWVANIPWIYSIQAEGARGLSSTGLADEAQVHTCRPGRGGASSPTRTMESIGAGLVRAPRQKLTFVPFVFSEPPS